MSVDTLLINGTDIASITGLVVEDLSGLHQDGPYRGANITLPGAPGQLSYAKVRDAYSFDVPVVLTGTTRQQFLDRLAALRALMAGSNLVTLTRRLTDGAGHIDTTCNAEYVAGTAVTLLNASNGRTILEFINLDGQWA